MLVPCQAGGSVLRVCMVQPPTKKAIDASAFRNGLRGKEVFTSSQTLHSQDSADQAH
jgi:hypothetical protein